MADVFNFYVKDDRSIQFNIAEPILLEDKDVTEFQFRIPKSLNGFDMSTWAWWFVYVNPKKEKYSYPLTLTDDEDEPEDYSVATFSINYGITEKEGGLQFALEVIDADEGGNVLHEWHTRTYHTAVIWTLQGNQVEYEEDITQDILSSILEQIAVNRTQIALNKARIDNIARLPEGSTTADAELIDIRVGANGETYPTAGDAVRGQVGELKEDLNLVNNGYYSFDLIADKYILRDNGQEANYTGWSATDFIEIPPHALAVYYGSANLTWGAQYDKNKSYVSAKTWNTQFSTLFNNSEDTIYFRTSCANADIPITKFKILPMVDPTLTKTGYPADAKTVGDALALSDARLDYIESDINLSVIPSYYQTQIATKESTIRGHFDDCAYNGDGLVFLTDTHFSADLFTSENPTSNFNANNSFALIKDVVDKTGISIIVFGGDLVNSATDIDAMLLSMASFQRKFGNRQARLRYCVGNHEYYTGSDLGATDKPTPSELYGAGIKYNEDVVLAKGDMDTYYFDNSAQKIRYFVVSCGRDTELTIPQVEWVLDAFLQIPDGYHVVVIGHAFVSDNMTTFRGRHQQIVNALDKVKIGSTFNYNNKDYDYSALNNVTPVCFITGHTHIDGVLNSTGGIPCICTTTDSYAQNYELVDGTPTKTPRTKGTTDEQAFDVFQFDFTNRKIYCTRIGYGSDREFSY